MSELDETLAATGADAPGTDALSQEDASAGGTPSETIAGRYHVEGLLGVGGMGRVYRAHDEELGELVALKMLRPELLGSADALARFRQEVKLARRVTHRNVARIFDIGEHAGQKFMTMELIDGPALSEELAARGALPEREGLSLFAEICAGVAAAHVQGIVHRDLKPGNVMIERGGRVVVTDFGLARGGLGSRESAAGEEQSMSMGEVVGTPAYMAPEQVTATPTGPTADVYALGLILFELLSGRRVWRGSSALMVAAKRVMEDAPSLARAYPEASDALVELVARCLVREPAGRFADAGALLEAVNRARGPLTKSELAASPSERPRTKTKTKTKTKTVAVLPFSNLGAEEDAGATAGLSEDLSDVLSMTGGLRLRHVTASAVADPLALGRELGVDVVVVGTVRRRAEQLRVSVRVIGVADGFQLWAGRFERPLREALALNDEVGQGVAQALSVDDPHVARPRANDARAVEIYLQLRAGMNQAFMSGGKAPELDAMLERALEVAPDNPLVLATWLGVRGWSASIFAGAWVTPEVEARLRKVLAAAPELASTWHAKAAVEFYGHRQAASAVISLRRALAINPGHSGAREMLAFILIEAGMLDEAMPHVQRGLWSDPTSGTLRVSAMHLHALRGDWARVTELVEGLDTERWREQGNIAAARYSWWAGRWLGTPFAELPAYTGPGRSITNSHAVLHRQVGPAELDRQATVFLSSAAPGSRAQSFLRQIMAEGAAFLGDQEMAWRFAREAEERGLLDTVWLARNPLLAELRARPEAQPLLAAAAARSQRIREAYEAELEPASGL